MGSRSLMCITAMTLFAALAIQVRPRLAAQEQQQNKQQPQYKLIDLGTFGGPSSYFIFTGLVLNNHGVAAGTADTSIPDPYAPNCFSPECLVTHAFQWQDGVLTDLGALPGVNGSVPSDINASGVIAGISENGMVDPTAPFPPEYHGVVWKDGQIIDLGTFGGNWSYANTINDHGEVAGFALNATPDSFGLGNLCFNSPGFPTQMRASVWQHGKLRNLGTLGGPDSCGLFINQQGEVAGHSFTNSTVNPVTGFPTTHPFLWTGSRMVDLHTLGGTLALAAAINNRTEVVGLSNLAGDLTFHPFLWKKGTLTDLGTLGGNNGQANWLNDAGEIVGKADLPGPLPQTHDAFLWKNGVMTDLGTQDGDPCSNALYISARGQIVGGSSDCTNFLHAFLSDNGGPLIDLNSFVPAGSNLTLTEATFINGRGEIGVQAVLPNGDQHAVVLIPCEGDDDGCQGENPVSVSQNNRPQATQRSTTVTPANPARGDRGLMDRLRARRFPGLRTLGPGTGPTN